MNFIQRLLTPYLLIPALAIGFGLVLMWYMAPVSGFNLWLDIHINLALSILGMWVMHRMLKNYPTQAGIYLRTLLGAFILAGLSTASALVLVKMVTVDPFYLLWFKGGWAVRGLLYFLCFGWMGLLAASRKRIEILHEKLTQNSNAASLLKEAELFKLRQQLQPHFLFNSLNALASLIAIAPEKAQDMVVKLSDFLRSSVQQEEGKLVLLSQELQHISSYLELEQIRFGDRLKVGIESDSQNTTLLPPFLLQPLVENAIKHGVYGTTGTVVIKLIAKEGNGYLHLTLSNPYDATAGQAAGAGFGLQSSHRRLLLLFGRADLLTTHAEDAIFTVHLKIPQTNV